MVAPSDDRERAEALAKRVTVGIVTALPEERAAMLAMLDQPVPYAFPGQGAGLIYDLAELPAHGGGHHVVALALADMGNNVAAARGALLLGHFPRVEAIIMVGIAGGVPNPNKVDDHVRLGDVVVSDRRGVIQYDFVKKKRRITEVRASPRPPHARLLEAVRLLESDALAGSKPWEAYVDRAKHLTGAIRPEAQRDVLLELREPFAPVDHPVDRKRTEGQPRIFMGPIASANVLLKDPVWRDQLREQYGVKAVEMEGSGIADATWMHGVGYLAVRGICDYCDSNKNDDWHMYASVVAAAYVRALLGRTASVGKEETESLKGAPTASGNENKQLGQSGNTLVTFQTFDDLSDAVCRLLSENRLLLETLGPNSEAASADPSSNLYQLWELRRLDRILPNNRKIIDMVTANTGLLSQAALSAFDKFKMHAEAYERHVRSPLDQYPRFPTEFAEEFKCHG
jgi:nucleoside phosphorylase